MDLKEIFQQEKYCFSSFLILWQNWQPLLQKNNFLILVTFDKWLDRKYFKTIVSFFLINYFYKKNLLIVKSVNAGSDLDPQHSS